MRAAGWVLLASGCAAPWASGQALPTATGPGSYTTVGLTGSAFASPYGQRNVAGAAAYFDGNLYRNYGVEVEVRRLSLHADEGVRQSTYLIGPRVSIRNPYSRTVRPYVKVLAGRGTFRFPFGYANGSYFVGAAGLGIDYVPGRGRVFIRIYDFEYQAWQGFTFGQYRPYGLSSGISLRVW